MSALSPFLRSLEGGRLAFWCPGCNEAHQVQVGPGSPPRWGYNGNPDAPTFTPSVLVRGSYPSDVPEEFDDPTKDKHIVCHSFVTDGRMQFLSDCTHALAGQAVPLPPFPGATR